MLSRPDMFMLYDKLGVDFFSISELIYPKMKVRIQLIRVSFLVFGFLGNLSTSIFNKKTHYNTVASVQQEKLFYRGTSREWSGIWCTWTCSWENRIWVCLKKNNVPAANNEDADSFENAASFFAEASSGRKNFKTAAECVRRQSLKNSLVCGRKKSNRAIGVRHASGFVPWKTAKRSSWSLRDVWQIFSLINSNKFWYQHFVAVSENPAGDVPLVDNVLSSHEKRTSSYHLIWQKLHRIWFSNRSVHLRWFETDLLGFENEIGQRSWLKSLLNQTTRKRARGRFKKAAEHGESQEEEEDVPVALVTHVNKFLLWTCLNS